MSTQNKTKRKQNKQTNNKPQKIEIPKRKNSQCTENFENKNKDSIYKIEKLTMHREFPKMYPKMYPKKKKKKKYKNTNKYKIKHLRITKHQNKIY